MLFGLFNCHNTKLLELLCIWLLETCSNPIRAILLLQMTNSSDQENPKAVSIRLHMTHSASDTVTSFPWNGDIGSFNNGSVMHYIWSVSNEWWLPVSKLAGSHRYVVLMKMWNFQYLAELWKKRKKERKKKKKQRLNHYLTFLWPDTTITHVKIRLQAQCITRFAELPLKVQWRMYPWICRWGYFDRKRQKWHDIYIPHSSSKCLIDCKILLEE